MEYNGGREYWNTNLMPSNLGSSQIVRLVILVINTGVEEGQRSNFPCIPLF